MISRFSRELVCTLLGWLIFSAAATAQQSGVFVRSPSTKLLTTAPGRIVTVSVVVTNRGRDVDEFSEQLTLPPGSQRVAPPELPFRLESGGQIVRVLAVFVPANAPAGQFVLGYLVQSRRDPSSSDRVDLALRVTPVDNLQLAVEPVPGTILAGDVYPVKVQVTNHGNSPLTVRLAAQSSLQLAVALDAASFTLAAGAAREIIGRVHTDRGLPRHTSHAVTFEVTASSPSGQALSASQASVVEIIPLVSGNPDPFHYFPVQLQLTGLTETRHDAQFQAELSGTGSLDEAGRQRVDFLFRGPDIQDSSLFGERDEYGATYHSDHWQVDLGDRVYALSPLTERHSLGRGAGVTWQQGRNAAGLFYFQTRFRQENSGETGAFARYAFTERFSMQVNLLRKTGGDFANERALPGNLVTLEANYRGGKWLDLEMEGGFSRGDTGVSDSAYRAAAHGELPGGLAYSIEHAHAGPDFFGYENDTDTTNLALALPITKSLRSHAAFNRYAGNLALNDIRSSVVNRENSWNAGLDYSFTRATEFSLEWQHIERADILFPAAYDFTEDFARLGASQDLGKLQLRSFLDLGTLDNRLTTEGGSFQRYNLTLNWQPTPTQSYSVFASYGPSAFSGSSDRNVTAGVSARWQLQEHLAANLSFARNQYDGRVGREQDQALVSLRYQLADKSFFSLIGRWSRQHLRDTTAGAGNEAALLASYTIPLRLPVSRKRSIGTLVGRLRDSTPGGAGVARAVLQIGEQFAVTDAEGTFSFPTLPPGNCELLVLPDSLGPRLAMQTALPLKLKIRPAETTRVNLDATPACALAVRVTRHEFASGNAFTAGALREAGGEEAVVVELTNGRETWRAQTDRTGAASFDRLPGGLWKVRLAARDLPEHHYLEISDRNLSLQPGTSQQLKVRVLPLARSMQLVDQGAVR